MNCKWDLSLHLRVDLEPLHLGLTEKCFLSMFVLVKANLIIEHEQKLVAEVLFHFCLTFTIAVPSTLTETDGKLAGAHRLIAFVEGHLILTNTEKLFLVVLNFKRYF